uniref:Protein trichome birefringence-like 19 n=1 Tax=Tanacetum cinerariifolium TaxID=118510 RepID=A0A699GYZ4_TANCI|nr:protein trichome birefringence-like 19 [Tanacetum cinerariifolium]
MPCSCDRRGMWDRRKDSILQAGNPVNEILLKLNQPDHRVLTNLVEVLDAVKEDPTLNKKVLDASEAVVTAQNDHLAKLAEFSASMKKETPSQPEGEQADMVIEEHKEEKVAKEKPKFTQPEPIQIVIPPTQYPKTPITPVGRVIEIPSQSILEVGESSVTFRVDKGKDITKELNPTSLKLVKVSKEIHPDPDAPLLTNYEIDGKMHHITDEELQALLDKMKQIKQVVKEHELSKTGVMKVAAEVVNEIRVIVKGIKDFIKHQDAHLKQDPSLSRRKRKAMKLDPEAYIVGLHCHRELPKGVKFVNNLVIEQPEHGLFFIDAFGDEAFQRVDDVHKVETETFLGYKVMASNVKTYENQRFNMLMCEMINKRLDKDGILRSKDFIKHQDAHLKVLTRAHIGKLKKQAELRKKRYDQYEWTLNNRFKPKRITYIFIHPNTKPVLVTIYRNNNPRNFHVHKEFKFDDFRLSEFGKLNAIIPIKRNKCVKVMMTSLCNKYERLKKILEELGLDESLPLLEQDLSLPRKKRKEMKLEPDTYITGLHCHRKMPKGVKFVNNLMIKQPEHGIFFIDVFGDEAFQRVDDVHKVETETFLGYKVMASNQSGVGYVHGKTNQSATIHVTTSKILLLVTLTLITFTCIPLYFPFHKFSSLSSSTHSSISLDAVSPGKQSDDTLITIDDNHHTCDVFSGDWVPNPDAPYYQNTTCWFIHDHQNCQKYGRPDSDFMKWRWKPNECDLPIFNPYQFLEIVRDKSLAFIGDSVGRNHMQSLICLLSVVEIPIDVSPTTDVYFARWKYVSYNFTMAAFWSPYLINYNQPDAHKAVFNLYLDEIDEKWTNNIDDFNYLVINAGHWFTRASLYHENRKVVGCKYCQKENITDYPMTFGYGRALRTAYKGIMSRKNFKGVTLLRTFAPMHFEGGNWNEAGHCIRKKPFKKNEIRLEGSNLELYSAQMEELKWAENQAKEIGLKLRIMDITEAMLLRPDGHPNEYGHWPNQTVAMYNDCVHWCLPGPIDTWNDFLLHMLKMEKSRLKWPIEGDENSRYFHLIVKKRERVNGINGLNVNGVWLIEPNSIKKKVFDYFTNRFHECDVERPSFINSNFKSLSYADRHMLDSLFTVKEIKLAVWDCSSSKTSWPDGYNFNFIRRFWDIIGDDIANCVRLFEHNGALSRGCNASFITLVPKVTDPVGLNDYRPISFLGCSYKFIAKVLANRSPTQEFNMEKGLRQGGPLSPFLFIVVIEALYVAILEASNSGLYKGTEFGPINENIFLLQYVDVSLFFGDCKLYGVGVGSLEVDRMARIMSCSYGCIPFVYLGLPVGKSIRNALAWHHIVDQFHNMLSRWKAEVLSSGGRLVVIKSILDFVFCGITLTRFITSHRDRSVTGRNGCEGDWCWTRDLRGRAYNDLSALIVTLSEVLHDGITVAAHKWVSLVPKKVNVFAWRLSLDRLPPRTKLVDSGVDLDSGLCPMCGKVPEDIDHIFSSCCFIVPVWKKILDWSGSTAMFVNALSSANFLIGDPKVNKAFFY